MNLRPQPLQHPVFDNEGETAGLGHATASTRLHQIWFKFESPLAHEEPPENQQGRVEA